MFLPKPLAPSAQSEPASFPKSRSPAANDAPRRSANVGICKLIRHKSRLRRNVLKHFNEELITVLLFCSSELPVRTKRWSCSNSLTELTLRLTTSLSRHLSSRETQANHSKKAHNPIQSCGQEIRCRAWLGEQQEPAVIMGPCKSTKFSLGKHQMHQSATRAQQLTWPASHDRVMIPWKLPQGWKAWKLLPLISEWSTDGVSEKLQLDWPPRNCLNGIWQCDPCPCFFAHLIEKVQPDEVGTLTCPGFATLFNF